MPQSALFKKNMLKFSFMVAVGHGFGVVGCGLWVVGGHGGNT